MEKLRFYKRPDDSELFEEEGHYPTEAALNYIRNWCTIWETEGETPVMKFGEYFGDKDKTQELLDYIKELWWYSDMGVDIEYGKVALHTLGWSGNEDIMRLLKHSSLWVMHWRKSYAGGHYYFDLNRQEEKFVYNDDMYNDAMHWFSLGFRAATENKTEELIPKTVNFKIQK